MMALGILARIFAWLTSGFVIVLYLVWMFKREEKQLRRYLSSLTTSCEAGQSCSVRGRNAPCARG